MQNKLIFIFISEMQPVFDEVRDSANHHIPAIAPAIQQKLNELWKPKE